MIFLEPLKKYAVFSGVASRKEFWMFFLFSFALYVVAMILDYAMGTVNFETGIGIFSVITYLAFFLPTLALTVRRLHDTNRSGWMYLLLFIPFVNIYIFCVIAFFSSRSDSRFGSGDGLQGTSFLD
mgnify:FL=1